MVSRFKAILFDLFDTLCHLDEPIYSLGKIRSARRLGVDPDRYLEEWMAIQEPCQRGQITGLSERIQTVARRLNQDLSREVHQILVAHEKSVLQSCARLHPDVLPTLRRLNDLSPLRTGLISNASGSTRGLLRSLDLEKYFHRLILSCEIGFIKPEPEIYLLACRRLSIDPSDCLFVGDGNGQELEGALEVGMTAVKIIRPEVMETYRTKPSRRWTAAIADLRELLELL